MMFQTTTAKCYIFTFIGKFLLQFFKKMTINYSKCTTALLNGLNDNDLFCIYMQWQTVIIAGGVNFNLAVPNKIYSLSQDSTI